MAGKNRAGENGARGPASSGVLPAGLLAKAGRGQMNRATGIPSCSSRSSREPRVARAWAASMSARGDPVLLMHLGGVVQNVAQHQRGLALGADDDAHVSRGVPGRGQAGHSLVICVSPHELDQPRSSSGHTHWGALGTVLPPAPDRGRPPSHPAQPVAGVGKVGTYSPLSDWRFQPTWSRCRWVIPTASISSGLMPWAWKSFSSSPHASPARRPASAPGRCPPGCSSRRSV